MNLEKALKIEGFTSPAELEWLAKQASGRRMIVEIGCWMGRSTRAMADNSNAAILAIDTWQGSNEPAHAKILADKPIGWLFDHFYENVKDKVALGLDENKLPNPGVYPCHGKSTGVAALVMPYKFRADMIFIDASHDYQSVADDIRAWHPFLTPGGLLCGHDFDAGRPGVVKAVRELVPGVAMAKAGSIWYAGTLS